MPEESKPSEGSKPNVSISITGGTFQDFVTGDKKTEVSGDYVEHQENYYGSNPEAAALAQELDAILQTLNTHPDDAAAPEAALQVLEKKPSLKQRLLAAITAGTITAIEEFCKHPLAKVALSALKAATEK